MPLDETYLEKPWADAPARDCAPRPIEENNDFDVIDVTEDNKIDFKAHMQSFKKRTEVDIPYV